MEGAEPLVLRGAMRAIKKHRIAHIVLEWNPEQWTSEGDLLDELFARYECLEITSCPLRVLRKIERDSLLGRSKAPTNLFFRSRTLRPSMASPDMSLT